MKLDDLEERVVDSPGIDPEMVRVKERPVAQIEANSLWEGGCSPHRPKGSRETVQVGIFIGTDGTPAIEKAKRRLTLQVGYPKVVLLTSADGAEMRVLGYPDSKAAAVVATRLGRKLLEVPKPSMAAEGAARTPMDTEILARNLQETSNVILQGPPGTGKTSKALEYVRSILSEDAGWSFEDCRFARLLERAGGEFDALLSARDAIDAPVVWEFLQTHPSYTYDDLVRSLVPTTQDGMPAFAVQDRTLPLLCRLASQRSGKPVVLILDEINRCDLGSVLGEFIFAIDPAHRGTPVRLQYQDQTGKLPTSVAAPSNLLIIGTMNTDDRSIALVDYAIRRRFRFVDVPSDPQVLDAYYASAPRKASLAKTILEACNENIPSRLKIGHAALLVDPLPENTWAGRIARRLAYHVVPILQEYLDEGITNKSRFQWESLDIPLNRQRQISAEVEASLRQNLTESLSSST